MVATKKVKKEEIVEAEVVSDPKEPKKSAKDYDTNLYKKAGQGRFFWGMLLVVLGVMFALENYLQIDVWQNLWPVVIILIGLSIVFGSFNKGKE